MKCENCKKKVIEILSLEIKNAEIDFKQIVPMINGLFIQSMRERYYMKYAKYAKKKD